MGGGIAHIMEMPAKLFSKNIHLTNTFEKLLEPSISSFGAVSSNISLEIILIFVSILVAFAGWFTGKYLYYYQEASITETITRKFYRIHNILYRKYYVDEIYEFLIVRPYFYISKGLFGIIDRAIIEFILIGLSVRLVYITGYLLRLFQNGYLYKIVCAGIIGLGLILYFIMGK